MPAEGPANATPGAYCIDLTEVTVARYRACVETPRDGLSCKPLSKGTYCNAGDAHPVNCVDWSTAAAFCRWAGGRLPTEAEWERAARGPSGTEDEPPDDAACWKRNSGAPGTTGTCPVGSFPHWKSWRGLLDVHGNVAEWTQDSDDPALTTVRFVRGGSWRDVVGKAVSASRRRGFAPSTIAESIGFRCARDPLP